MGGTVVTQCSMQKPSDGSERLIRGKKRWLELKLTECVKWQTKNELRLTAMEKLILDIGPTTLESLT